METNRKVVKPRAFSPVQKLTEDTRKMGFNGVFFGQPGVGKTTFSLSAQGTTYGGNALLHDADEGRESVLDVEADYYIPRTWRELRENLDTALALKDDTPYQTHVFDSLSSIWTLLMEHMEKTNGNKDGRAVYYAAQKELVKFARDAKSLCEYGINTIFVGHVVEDKPSEDEPALIRLALPPKTRNEILLVVNHVGYLDRVKRSEDRVLYLKPPNTKTEGPKFRQTKSAEQIPLEITNPNLGNILTQLREGVK